MSHSEREPLMGSGLMLPTAWRTWTATAPNGAGCPPRSSAFIMGSTDGLLDSAMIRCPAGR